MKKITGAEIPELSVSIEASEEDNYVDLPEPKSNIPEKVNGEEIQPVELPDISEVPELSVSIEASGEDNSAEAQEPKSNIPEKVDGEEIPPVELPDIADERNERCTNLSCLLNTVLDNIQEIVA